MRTKLILSFIVLLFVLTSCYYEDGPFYSLRTRKQRLAQTWRYDRVRINNLDITNNFADYTLTFTKENDVTWHTLSKDDSGIDSIYISSGRWEFDAPNYRKLDLFFIDSTTHQMSGQSWEIHRLTKKQLWLYSKTSDAVVEYFMISQD